MPVRRIASALRRAIWGPSLAPVDEVFDTWAVDGREARMERAHGPVARRAFDELPLRADSWFLDIGCGNGYAVRWAAEAAPEGLAYGIDASAEMVRVAREQSAAHPNAEFQQALFPRHRLPHEAFDAVFSVEAFYYVDDVEASLAEVLRLLKPGGLFVTVSDFYEENHDSHNWPGYVGTHMMLLGERDWLRMFVAAGFDAVRQRRLVVPPEEAVESWHATVGSLVTVGRRPR